MSAGEIYFIISSGKSRTECLSGPKVKIKVKNSAIKSEDLEVHDGGTSQLSSQRRMVKYKCFETVFKSSYKLTPLFPVMSALKL